MWGVTIMEPQDTIYCYDNKENKCKSKVGCLVIIAGIIFAAFATVIGIILGATLATTFLEALAAIIVLAVVLGILFILTLILMICNKGKDKKHKCKCC